VNSDGIRHENLFLAEKALDIEVVDSWNFTIGRSRLREYKNAVTLQR